MSMQPPLWQKAVAFAAERHRHHVRKDGKTPYVSHVFRVALTLRDLFGCDDQPALCAAILHDTIEDTPTDFDDIEERFGEDIALMVAALTKNMLLREDDRERDYDARLARADWRARLIKLADAYDNLTDTLARGAGPKAIERICSKSDRAVALARPDAADHEVVRRALMLVEQLITDARGAQ